MTLDQVDRIVRQANPVPDPKALEQVDPSVLDHWRRTEMLTQDPIEVVYEPEKERSWTWLAIAALAAVIVGALLLMQPGATPIADAPTTLTEVPAPAQDGAVETAAAFFEAFAAFDADRAAVYLAPDALDEFGGSIEAMRLQLAVGEAMRQVRIMQGCRQLEVRATGTVVRCDYTYHALGSDLLGRGPYDGNWFDFTVRAREIVAAKQREYRTSEFLNQMWEPFALWLAETYPEDVDVLYTNATQAIQAVSEESRVRWAERLDEWIGLGAPRGAAATLAEAFVDAFMKFDAETLATYLAPEADMSSFEWDGGTWPLTLRLLEAQGFQAELFDCHPVSTSNARTVLSCPIEFHILRSNEIGIGPFGGSAFALTVVDNRITRASLNLQVIKEFSPTMWEPFAAWLLATYPEDVALMYTDASQSLEALTEESIALWEQRTREYVASFDA